MNNKWSKENMIIIINQNKTIAGCLRDMSLSPTGSNYTKFKMEVKKYDISTSHFKGKF